MLNVIWGWHISGDLPLASLVSIAILSFGSFHCNAVYGKDSTDATPLLQNSCPIYAGIPFESCLMYCDCGFWCHHDYPITPDSHPYHSTSNLLMMSLLHHTEVEDAARVGIANITLSSALALLYYTFFLTASFLLKEKGVYVTCHLDLKKLFLYTEFSSLHLSVVRLYFIEIYLLSVNFVKDEPHEIKSGEQGSRKSDIFCRRSAGVISSPCRIRSC